jgi:site-specific DNA-methyltransferase (adenine-specific)
MLQNTDKTPINYTACCTLADLNHQPTIEAQKIKNAKRGDINFYLCDNIEFMKTKPDKYYDLAIVDPPYGIGASKDSRVGGSYTVNLGGKKHKVEAKAYTQKDWDFKKPTAEYWEQLKRVSKNQIVWGGNYFIANLHETSCWIVWNKKNGENNNADCELAWTSFDTAVRMFEWKWNGFLQQNMKDKQERIHPTEKPIQLYQWLFMNYWKKGMRVLDTHGGSFSIAIAADKEQVELDVCEIDNEYFDNGLQRYDMYKRQLKLF